MEFDLRNEVAGLVAVGGFLALLALLAGATTLVRAAVGVGSSLGVVAGALATALGLAGLLGTWAAVESGYFEPEEAVEPESDSGSEPPAEADSDQSAAEPDVEAA